MRETTGLSGLWTSGWSAVVSFARLSVGTEREEWSREGRKRGDGSLRRLSDRFDV